MSTLAVLIALGVAFVVIVVSGRIFYNNVMEDGKNE